MRFPRRLSKREPQSVAVQPYRPTWLPQEPPRDTDHGPAAELAALAHHRATRDVWSGTRDTDRSQ